MGKQRVHPLPSRPAEAAGLETQLPGYGGAAGHIQREPASTQEAHRVGQPLPSLPLLGLILATLLGHHNFCLEISQPLEMTGEAPTQPAGPSRCSGGPQCATPAWWLRPRGATLRPVGQGYVPLLTDGAGAFVTKGHI